MPENNEAIVVPSSAEPEEERKRIRRSNDLDQKLEREGIEAPHNRGYDEAADGRVRPPVIDDVTES